MPCSLLQEGKNTTNAQNALKTQKTGRLRFEIIPVLLHCLPNIYCIFCACSCGFIKALRVTAQRN
jgi:hypothetical protein